MFPRAALWMFDISGEHYFVVLGPGQPSAGGPKMDGRAVTSLGVVKISRLTSRLWRSARSGGDLIQQQC